MLFRGVWWHLENNYIVFLGRETDPDFKYEGPNLMPFNENTLQSAKLH